MIESSKSPETTKLPKSKPKALFYCNTSKTSCNSPAASFRDNLIDLRRREGYAEHRS